MNSDGKKLGICVIGSGRAGMIHARNFARGVAGARLVALADAHAPTLEAARRELDVETGFADYKDALADPRVDAVVVVTPTSLHRDIVLQAARAGKHVLCEKPMAMDVRECDQMIAACDAAKREAADRLHAPLRRKLPLREGPRGRGGNRGRRAGEVRRPRPQRSPGMDVRHQEEQRPPCRGEQPRHRLRPAGSRAATSTRSTPSAATTAARRPCRSTRTSTTTWPWSAVSLNGKQGIIDGAASVGYGYDARMEIVGTSRGHLRGKASGGLRRHLLDRKGHRPAVREELAHPVHRSLRCRRPGFRGLHPGRPGAASCAASTAGWPWRW